MLVWLMTQAPRCSGRLKNISWMETSHWQRNGTYDTTDFKLWHHIKDEKIIKLLSCEFHYSDSFQIFRKV